MKRQSLSITLQIWTCNRLQEEIGKAMISSFVEEAVLEKLNEKEKILGEAYQKAYSGKSRSILLEDNNDWENSQFDNSCLESAYC